MTQHEHIPLARRFSLLPRTKQDAESYEFISRAQKQAAIGWEAFEQSPLCVILAGAGVGKTHEMRTRAKHLRGGGCISFFIRIEDIDQDFASAFEIGDETDFQNWLSSSEEAWFFLDSVDEARLSAPRAFEQAIRRFAARIRDARPRAHVVVSSRPYAWRSHSDAAMLAEHLPFVRPRDRRAEGDSFDGGAMFQNGGGETESALDVYMLEAFTEENIRTFAEKRGAERVEDLVDEIRRKNLLSVASRPFDLDEILRKWRDHGKLGDRLEVLQYGIEARLAEHNPQRRQESLSKEQARKGARLLAAAVVFTGAAGLRIPDGGAAQEGIDAETVLADWDPLQIRILLERSVFDDAIYGMVRFRHREVRELLAAEWLQEHLSKGNARHAVEALLFRETYGQFIIPPRLRPVLSWLILWDDDIRRKAVEISPEIAIEGGDVARLPVGERRELLRKIARRISEEQDVRSAYDYEAVSRIALPDLEDEALRLIEAHRNDDRALVFFGRLVWQGKLTACLTAMASVAMDPKRGLSARIFALQAVLSIGARRQAEELWDHLLNAEEMIDRQLLAVIVQEAPPDMETVARLVGSFAKLHPDERFYISGLTEDLRQFIERFDLATSSGEAALTSFLQGLNEHLGRAPHLEGGRTPLSQEFIWLLGAAACAAERLIVARSASAFDIETMEALQKISAARFWSQDIGLEDQAQSLGARIREWTEFHDALFWTCVGAERTHRLVTTEKALTDDWPVIAFESHCFFDGDDFNRVLGFIDERPLEDDKLVAISLACRLIRSFDLPPAAMTALKAKLKGRKALEQKLQTLTAKKKLSKAEIAQNAHYAKSKLERDRKKRIVDENRQGWISALKADPDLVNRPPSCDAWRFWLMRQIPGGSYTRWANGNWRGLIEVFGESVAEAYRDAAMAHWRDFTPPLVSEGHEKDGVPEVLIFGLSGLEMEAAEIEGFPAHLSDEELRLALRYAIWELNGFPIWCETAYRDRPEIVAEAFLTELHWDLRQDKVEPRILHDLVYYAPWLHERIAEEILGWLETNEARDVETLRYLLSIASRHPDETRLTALAKNKVATSATLAEQAQWFALWVDRDAQSSIPELENWLEAPPPEDASLAAQHFITSLLGSRRGAGFARVRSYRTAEKLKRLYLLMHQHIRAEEDIDRLGKGVYTPELRDGAQDGRNALFNLMTELSGKATWVALRELAETHPIPDLRSWMALQAFRRAEKDGDLDLWSAQQVREFETSQTLTPVTHRQLFELTVDRLLDMKAWLEDGDDSPYRTWARPEDETEMRNLVAGRLKDKAMGRYVCAQENELPNGQRPDIWMQSPQASAPVPIELKLLDQRWSGPSLCERLRNQLAGDYLRDKGTRSGVMLLVWQGRGEQGRWTIDGCRESVETLESALQNYWRSISRQSPEIDDTRVILIDLEKRARKART
ncbi:hypothetical protein [Neomegalonema sp.]|uniref:NACHT domain-containing protein n=1 Tax=Neomegalonema sp. TaxID=2039713 RepID=UPI002636904F|nr:hypothetical protein [Neomegalonema sp.]MDD2870144.1 hypothetical protein [Neomegalonema sp.]